MPAQDSSSSTGGTKVSVEGSLVTITVNIDLALGGQGETTIPEGAQATADGIAQEIAAYWNQGFERLSSVCLRFKLVVNIKVVPQADAHLLLLGENRMTWITTPGRHVVFWGENNFGNAAPPETYDEYDEDGIAPPGEDYSTPLDHELWAMWSPHLETARDFAHELGHLMGFGDDYANGEALPGREGTLMDGGDFIDQNLVDRLADLVSPFLRRSDPTAEIGCGLWTGTVETHYWERNREDNRDWHIVAEVRLREVNFVPLLDPGPEHGGHKAGARVGSQVQLECAGTTIHETSRMDIWSLTDDYRQTCTTAGSKTIGAGTTTDGLLFRKSADIDLTPILGFDMPLGGGLYTFSCSPGFTKDLPYTCTSSSSYAGVQTYNDLLDFTGPATVGGADSAPYRGCYDPEVRFLVGGGKQMTGTYRYDQSPGDCVPHHADVVWSLCQVGTPCAPLPPLPEAPETLDAPP